jgi:hypothetical protein
MTQAKNLPTPPAYSDLRGEQYLARLIETLKQERQG